MSLPSHLYVADKRIVFDTENLHLSVDGERLTDFSDEEYFIFQYFAAHPDITVHKEDAIRDVWGKYSFKTENQATKAISGGRRKLGPELGDRNTGAFRYRRGFGIIALTQMDIRLPWPETGKVYSFGEGVLEVHDEGNVARVMGEVNETLSPANIRMLKALGKHMGQYLDIHTWGVYSKVHAPHANINSLKQSLEPIFPQVIEEKGKRNRSYKGIS
jgi:DNA-binding winged helix-turn-helix (wHTH) protein